MNWEDILKIDRKKLLEEYKSEKGLDLASLSPKEKKEFMSAYEKDGEKRDMTLKEFAKKIEPMMEQILNYHVFDESDYNDETRDKLETALNQAFNFNRIEVDYVPDDSAYYIDLTGEKSEGEGRTYKFDKNGRFEFVR